VLAGIIAAYNVLRAHHGVHVPALGFLNPLLYQAAAAHADAFFDVTEGSNRCLEQGFGCCAEGFTACTGWDPVGGLGSPNFQVLQQWMAPPGETFTRILSDAPAARSNYCFSMCDAQSRLGASFSKWPPVPSWPSHAPPQPPPQARGYTTRGCTYSWHVQLPSSAWLVSACCVAHVHAALATLSYSAATPRLRTLTCTPLSLHKPTWCAVKFGASEIPFAASQSE